MIISSVQCLPNDTKLFSFFAVGPYHPYLDTLSSMFQTESVFAMSRMTLLPPMRFQRTTLYYDNNNIYMTTTMVGEARTLSKSNTQLNIY